MSKLLMGGVNVEGVVRRTLTLVQLFLDLHHIRRPLRAYRTRVDDRVPIDIVDTGHDALLEFLLGSHPDVTQDRARSFRHKRGIHEQINSSMTASFIESDV
jgi:hypothetical protein